jgi:hypothetical protein
MSMTMPWKALIEVTKKPLLFEQPHPNMQDKWAWFMQQGIIVVVLWDR